MDKSKKLKQRFTQMLLRSSCTTTTTTSTAAAALVSLSKNNSSTIQHCDTPPRRHVRTAPVVQISIDCGGGGGGRRSFDDVKKSKKSEKRAVQDAKIKAMCKVKEKEVTKLVSNAYGFSTSSSAESDTELGLFSSSDERDEREEETRTLFSYMSFSSDSSEFHYYRNPHPSKKKNSHTKKPARRSSSKSNRDYSPLVSISSTEKKPEKPVRSAESGFAVVKKSSDPYKDFKSSMVEMIVEQRMSSIKDMERLLQSYLELNSPHHHAVILAAFTDIWEAIFGEQ
ncbi:uncharacterized protein [Typha angustifolia]|uniref:uncharacterized protein n=1 Tax=Typha angustifolia TaxID=59011 RepID=UPI003C2B8844